MRRVSKRAQALVDTSDSPILIADLIGVHYHREDVVDHKFPSWEVAQVSQQRGPVLFGLYIIGCKYTEAHPQ